MRIAVIGGTGLVGAHAVQALGRARHEAWWWPARAALT